MLVVVYSKKSLCYPCCLPYLTLNCFFLYNNCTCFSNLLQEFIVYFYRVYIKGVQHILQFIYLHNKNTIISGKIDTYLGPFSSDLFYHFILQFSFLTQCLSNHSALSNWNDSVMFAFFFVFVYFNSPSPYYYNIHITLIIYLLLVFSHIILFILWRRLSSNGPSAARKDKTNTQNDPQRDFLYFDIFTLWVAPIALDVEEEAFIRIMRLYSSSLSV